MIGMMIRTTLAVAVNGYSVGVVHSSWRHYFVKHSDTDRLNPGMVSEVKIIEEKRRTTRWQKMIPVVLATAFVVGRVTIMVTFGSVAGTSYAYGRKVGM